MNLQSKVGSSSSSSKPLLSVLFPKDVLDERRKYWETLFEKYGKPGDIQCTTEMNISKYVESLEVQAEQQFTEIRTIIFKRNESRILQDGHFEQWNKQLEQACIPLRDIVLTDDVLAFTRKLLKKKLPARERKIIKKSNLEKNLIIRRALKKQGLRCDNINSLTLDIRREWKKLLKVTSLESLVIFSLDALKKYQEKEQGERQR